MSDLLAARSPMAMSLAFHILFAAVGIAMPLMMVIPLNGCGCVRGRRFT